ncbi:hypothetical protein BBJ28_00017403 [Nothophytophthora sp. Chile5]|nr:hypothetical protein BBJ28_00017403 [Nothophytophthora sp. Chile5]
MEVGASSPSQRLAEGAEQIRRHPNEEEEASPDGVGLASSLAATTDEDDSEPRETDRCRPTKKRKATYLVTKRGPAPSPLYSYIHLGVDDDARRRTLLSIRDSKIQNGLDFVEAHSQHLDLLQPYSSVEHFVDSEGDFCCVNFDVIQFSGVRSVREVYNAAMFHFLNEEITLSERLGHITVRDDYNAVLDNFSNCRLSSADENGVKTETNTAAFAAFMDGEQSPSGTSFAVLVRDSVDVDDLYPYNPSEYVRKDHSGAVVLTAMKRKKEVGESSTTVEGPEDEEELVVVMRRAGYVKIHRPAFPLPDQTQQALLTGMTDWCDVMLATMRSLLTRGDLIPLCDTCKWTPRGPVEFS